MESNPLRGLFGVSSPRPVEQRVAPQPTAPTESIEYEIPSSMIEKMLANPYAGDGTEHPDMHLIYVEQICGLFKLAGLPEDEVMKKVKKDKFYPYNKVLFLCISALLPLVFGGSIGPEAGLTGVIVGLCYWAGSHMKDAKSKIPELM